MVNTDASSGQHASWRSRLAGKMMAASTQVELCGWFEEETSSSAAQSSCGASQREELIEAMLPDSRTPWTFSRLAEELGGNQYQDISAEKPTPEEWTRAQRVEEEAAPVRHRIRHKRPEPASEDEELIPDQGGDQSSSSQQPLPQRPRMQPRTGPHVESHTGWWSDVSPETWATSQGDAYWQDEAAAVCVEVVAGRRR